MGTRDQEEAAGTGGGLFVRTSDEDLIRWNRQRIVNALLRETDVPRETAVEISREIQEMINRAGIRHLSTSLIRELVDTRLLERGLESQQARHCRLGMPVFDAETLITRCGPEGSSSVGGPEATNRLLAESIKKDFALLSLFSDGVADAHRRGDIHLEHLGQVDRPAACLISPEFIKKFGLSLPGTLSNARPARRPEVFLAHLARFSAFLQGHYSGTIAWELVNVFVAPFLAGASAGEVGQLAQFLVYEFSQLSAARDSRPIQCDLHLYWGVPPALRRVPALGPGGVETGRVYGDYRAEARAFARAVLEVMRDGDGDGSPFFSPNLLVHLDAGLAREPGSGPFLSLAADLAVRSGTPLFLFDRGGGASLAGIGPRELMEAPGAGADGAPWTRRCHTLQTLSLNLPRLALRAGGSDERLAQLTAQLLALGATAHLEKRVFLERLLAYGRGGPLSLLMLRRDGTPLLDLERTCHLIGLCGLNEMVQAHTGKQMHESPKALRFAREVVKGIARTCAELSRQHRVRFLASESLSGLAVQRFARKDLRGHSPRSGHLVKGDIAAGAVHYTRAARLAEAAGVPLAAKAAAEGEFHPHLAGGALCELPLCGPPPPAREVVRFLRRVFGQTLCAELAFSPRFRCCPECLRARRDGEALCPGCGGSGGEPILRSGLYYVKPAPGEVEGLPDPQGPAYGAADFASRE